jgi:hypothetical protein
MWSAAERATQQMADAAELMGRHLVAWASTLGRAFSGALE